MSQIITPPDLVEDPNSILLVNISKLDLEMVIHWCRLKERNLSLYLCSTPTDTDWLKKAATNAKNILVDKEITQAKEIVHMYENISKIVWLGNDQKYHNSIEYLIKNERV